MLDICRNPGSLAGTKNLVSAFDVPFNMCSQARCSGCEFAGTGYIFKQMGLSQAEVNSKKGNLNRNHMGYQ